MAKAKGGKRKAFRDRRAAPEAPENPFERLSNKKRFDILGRKVKGETRETGKLRSAAAEKRKNTLLVEYKQLRKSNAFVDRRFGENDKTMTEEEKSLLRLQKQRLFDVAGGKFALPEEEDPRHVLTHGGRSLADQDWGAYGGGDFEGDDEAWADATDPALSFGGGLFERAEPRLERNAEDKEDPTTASQPAKKRTHAEIMAEVVGKAKAFKAARQQQRDDDVAEAEALDEAFSSLAAQGALKNLTVAKGERRDAHRGREPSEFDALARELVHAPRGGVADPAARAEVAAAEESRRLEEAERAQRRRMRESGMREDAGGEVVGGGGPAAPAGGYAARRARDRAEREGAGEGGAAARRGLDESADALGEYGEYGSAEEEEEEDEGEEGGAPANALEARRQERAQGDHPLQDAFREAARRLLDRHEGEEDGGGESGDEGEEDGGEESGDEGGNSEENSESGDEEEENSEGDSESGDEGENSEESESEGNVEEENQRNLASASAPAPPQAQPVPPCLPPTYEAFEASLSEVSPSQLRAHLSAFQESRALELRRDAHRGSQLLFGYLLSYWLRSARGSPARLDAALPALLSLSRRVPLYAAAAARARLALVSERMRARMEDGDAGAAGWPRGGELALLLLLPRLFPPTDRRHPVLAGLGVLVAWALARCPLASPGQTAAALLLGGLQLHLNAEARRHAPEALGLAARVLRAFGRAQETEEEEEEQEGAAVELDPRAAEAPALARMLQLPSDLSAPSRSKSEALSTEDPAPSSVPPASLTLSWHAVVAGTREDGADLFAAPLFPLSALLAACQIVSRAADALDDCEAAPEALAPAREALETALEALEALRDRKAAVTRAEAARPAFAFALAACAGALAKLNALRKRCLRRLPLSLRAMEGKAETRSFAPRFEESFALERDYDLDRERAEQRRLRRAVRREERGAVRELRRDAAFMAGVRDREKRTAQETLDASARRAMAFLEGQEADFRSGGQGGMWKKKKRA